MNESTHAETHRVLQWMTVQIAKCTLYLLVFVCISYIGYEDYFNRFWVIFKRQNNFRVTLSIFTLFVVFYVHWLICTTARAQRPVRVALTSLIDCSTTHLRIEFARTPRASSSRRWQTDWQTDASTAAAAVYIAGMERTEAHSQSLYCTVLGLRDLRGCLKPTHVIQSLGN